MNLLSMRLDVGFATHDLSSVVPMIEQWLGRKLESDDDLELGGLFFRYLPSPLPKAGLCGVRARQNHVEGLGWRLKHRQDLAVCAEVELCGPDVLVLGRVASRLRGVCGNLASVAAYVITRSPFNSEDPVFPRAHTVHFDSDGRTATAYPELFCVLTFGFDTNDFTVAGQIGAELLKSSPIERESETLGGRYLEFAGGIRDGLIRSNQLSLVNWLYPRHRYHTLLLDISWRTPNLLELGELALYFEESAAAHLSLIGYRIVGDLVRDRMPRLLSFERGTLSKGNFESPIDI